MPPPCARHRSLWPCVHHHAYAIPNMPSQLLNKGKGSAGCVDHHRDAIVARQMAMGAGRVFHGRLYFNNPRLLWRSDGHGPHLPHMDARGPGLAGGWRGAWRRCAASWHYMQRTAIQVQPRHSLTAINKQWDPRRDRDFGPRPHRSPATLVRH